MLLWSLGIALTVSQFHHDLSLKPFFFFFFLRSRWSWETLIFLWTLDHKCASRGGFKVVFALSSIKHCTVTLFTYSVYYSALFSFLSSLCGAINAVLPLPCGEGPFLSPCASVSNLLSSGWYMAGFNCDWVIFGKRRDLFVMNMSVSLFFKRENPQGHTLQSIG